MASRRDPLASAAVGAGPLALAMRCALWLLLGSWIGGWLLFGAVVAPTAFRVLPTTEVAGQLVGPVLTALHLYGAAAGIALAILARALGRPLPLVAVPLAMSAACFYSHFGISAEMDEIRGLAFGPAGSAEIAGRFNQLHRLSVGIFIAVGLAAIALLVLYAREEGRGAPDPRVGAAPTSA